jgi:hypothetical protein
MVVLGPDASNLLQHPRNLLSLLPRQAVHDAAACDAPGSAVAAAGGCRSLLLLLPPLLRLLLDDGAALACRCCCCGLCTRLVALDILYELHHADGHLGLLVALPDLWHHCQQQVGPQEARLLGGTEGTQAGRQQGCSAEHNSDSASEGVLRRVAVG